MNQEELTGLIIFAVFAALFTMGRTLPLKGKIASLKLGLLSSVIGVIGYVFYSPKISVIEASFVSIAVLLTSIFGIRFARACTKCNLLFFTQNLPFKVVTSCTKCGKPTTAI